MPEARLDDSGSGLAPASDGWFVVNVREAEWWTAENGEKQPSGSACDFVLSGECRLLVEDEERLLRPWDFFHSPAGTEHIFVGAGDGPCVILMAGARMGDHGQVLYPVSELAERYGASAKEETSDPGQAYVGFEPSRRERPSYWDRLPWT